MEDSYGHPKVLEESEYREYIVYLHLTEAGTNQLRDELKTLTASVWDNIAYTGIDHKGNFLMEVQNIEKTHVRRFTMTPQDFRIVHYPQGENGPMEIDVDFMLLRMGGATREGTDGMIAFPKSEVRIFVDQAGDVDVG